MATQLTLDEVLEKAIQKEIEARLLYTDLSRKIEQRAAKEAFQELAQQEQEHQNLLERYLRGDIREGALNRKQALDYKLAEYFQHEAVTSDMELKDIFLFAAEREQAAHELYLGLAEVQPAEEVKRLFEGLAAQELGHKQRVEFLYTEVAFPQTDGG